MGKNTKHIWDRSQDGNAYEQRSFLRYAIVATALAVVFLFVKKDSIVRWVQAGFTIRDQERQIKNYVEDNARLDGQIRMMTADKDTLETFARENFFFSEPGDDVYIIEE